MRVSRAPTFYGTALRLPVTFCLLLAGEHLDLIGKALSSLRKSAKTIRVILSLSVSCHNGFEPRSVLDLDTCCYLLALAVCLNSIQLSMLTYRVLKVMQCLGRYCYELELVYLGLDRAHGERRKQCGP